MLLSASKWNLDLGSLARTTWTSAFLDTYATDFQSSNTPTFPTIQGVTNINSNNILCSRNRIDQVDASGHKLQYHLYNLEL